MGRTRRKSGRHRLLDEEKETIGRLLARLTSREQRVMRMRFGIGEKSNHTLEEVGQDFEVTRKRLREIEAKAMRALGHRRPGRR